ncbi:SDR family NAD(P)-dependent oxidoreductase [Solimonas variicoloris]|uniref:SDR family NAD(P)-dependent oxidoreductase n=1 Tax=Solimonas variicoloris TaxID=254408 RepID=UPI00036477BE|nr:SDR family oxidoreductase [Solimonas variicoloris]
MHEAVVGAALVTGASSGLGAEYARQLAARGYDLILVARSQDRLEALATELRAVPGARVEVIRADLAEPGAGLALAARVEALGWPVAMLVNNAGFGVAGHSAALDPARLQQMITLNCATLVELTQAFLPAMLARRAGAIINVASLAGFQPMPYMAVYGATKAFVLSYTEALWAETRERGLRCLAVCPGPVDTPFFEAAGGSHLRQAVPPALMARPADVVARSLRALDRGCTTLVPGLANRMVAMLPRLLPRHWLAASTARVMRR